MTNGEVRFLVITGQTASGKEGVALTVAERLGGEIVSLDSMKVYRGLDIGTAKPSAAARRRVPHHLLDVVNPWERFSAARWAELAEAALGEIRGRGRVAIVSGGTILYLKALLYGLFEGPAADAALRAGLEEEAARLGVTSLHARLAGIDPAAARRIHPNDLRRIVRALEVQQLTGRPISEQQGQFGRLRPGLAPVVIALRRGREDLARRIDERVERMLAAGFEEEVQRLLAAPGGLSAEAAQAVGYREMIEMIQGRRGREDLAAEIKKNTRRFAKQQMTHLRSIKGCVWLDVAAGETVEAVAARVVEAWNQPAGA
jgi:tRNA dimethylallyltransferase